MNKKYIIAGLVLIVIGAGIGYAEYGQHAQGKKAPQMKTIQFIWGHTASTATKVAEEYFAKAISDSNALIDAGSANTQRTQVGVVTEDLNDDGVNEIIATIHGSSVCGVNQCPIVIFMHKGDEWEPLGGPDVAQSITLATTYTKGMRDIIYNKNKAANAPGTIWKWNGKAYVASK